ncbi:hypothetical protein [Thermomonospora umbrina]|uniref:DUF4190 domain-containing protein n=1 Tax=Thermomonospora umbrina TaxID=111806 RepID=A0A3D9SMT8_9ACTN|nr:hypothetical protein [Thermomonospora umbrina]REE97242.1 hypothetical protein DFJ69_2706 [Thermomonospora umbrina]
MSTTYQASDASAPSRLPLGVQADGTLTRKATPIAFVMGTLAVLVLLPLGVLGVILNNMGLERVQSSPEPARKLINWSWGILAVADVLALVLIIAMVVASL